MKKNEILNKIAAYIDGQGNQVLGEKIAEVERGIVSMFSELSEGGIKPASATTLGGIMLGVAETASEVGIAGTEEAPVIKLPTSPNSILGGGGGGNSPLIVEGTLDAVDIGYEFTPNAGQPSYAEAEAAFLNGTPVFFKITDPDDGDIMTGLFIANNIPGMSNEELFGWLTRADGSSPSVVRWPYL